MKYITILFLFIAQLSFAQSKSLTKVIDRIDYQSDTLQAVFDWVTDNIKYDVAMLKAMEKGGRSSKNEKYKSSEERKAAMLENVIKRKKGVCQDYSLLFDAIMQELGYQSHIIQGITKDKKGKIRKSIGHTWNTVNINGKWKLYDPTWGAGYVKDDKKFVKKYNPKWYDVDAEEIKITHFPFDPIWQLSTNPMTFQEFEKGNQTEAAEEPYDFETMISAYLSKTEKEQFIDQLSRLDTNGGNIKPIKNHRSYLTRKISYTDIPAILEDCRVSSEQFAEYFKQGKNKKFSGEKWTLEYSRNTLLDIKEQLEESIVAFGNVKMKGSKGKRAFKKNVAQSKKFLKRVEGELTFLEAKMQ